MDYSAFSESEIKKYNGKIKGLPWLMPPMISRIILFVVLWFFIVNPVFFIILAAMGANSLVVTLTFLLYIPINIVLWIVLGKSIKSGMDYSIRSALFAQTNNFSYAHQSGLYQSKAITSSVLGNPMTSNVVDGAIDGIPFSLFSTFGKGFYTILRVQLPNLYPHILLDSKNNNFIISNLLKNFPNNKEIILEGDFPKYFRVFSAGSPVETLQILSPDLMAKMLDYPKKADIEIIDNELHIVLNFKTLEESDIRMLFESAKQILNDIGASSNNAKVSFDTSSES